MHVHSHLTHLLFGRGAPDCCRATLKSGIRNRKEIENLNPEFTNQRKQVLQISEKLLCELFPLKIREQVKSPQTGVLCLFKFVQPLYLVRAINMEEGFPG